MSKYRLIEKSPGRWQCGLPGAAPMFELAAPNRESALSQIKASLAGTAKLAAAIGVGLGTPKAPRAAAPVPTDAELAKEVRRLEREIAKFTGSEHRGRMAAAFQDGSSQPGVSFDGRVQRFSLKGGTR